jgi:hypothetical protein
MTAIPGGSAPDAGSREPTAEEIEAFEHDALFEPPGGLVPADFEVRLSRAWASAGVATPGPGFAAARFLIIGSDPAAGPQP